MFNITDSYAVRDGQAILEVEMIFGESAVTSAAASSPMKILTPVARGRSVWAFTSSFGGGLVAGDQTRLEVTVGTGARCFLSTQSSTKVYRNPGARPCSHTTKAVLEADSLLVFAPEPVQAFADSRYTQRQEFRLKSGAGLVLLDWFTSGRAARGERWAFARLESRNDLYINGERTLVDPVLLSSATVVQHMGRFNCFATLLLIGAPLKAAGDALVHALAAQPVEKRATQSFSAGSVPDGVLVRIAGTEVEKVRHALQHHLGFVSEFLGDNPWARKW
jgi:urease accessory protein